jgi:hypothetical protein
VSWTMTAATAAADRLIAVSWNDPQLAFAAAGETLWWIRTLDQCLERKMGMQYVATRSSENVVAAQLLGLKFARDRITHAFDVLEPVEPGGQLAAQDYGTPGYWKWRDIGLSKRSGNQRGEPEYRKYLMGRYVQSTLTHVLTFLRAQAWRVDGPLNAPGF